MTGLIFILAAVLIFGLASYLMSRRMLHRKALIGSPLSEEWEAAIRKNFPRFYELSAPLQQTVTGIAHVIASEKNFEACGDLDQITEEMRALISVQAALLIARVPRHRYYPKLRSILVYPTAFRDQGHRRFGVSAPEGRGVHLGESWETGSIILSWESVVAGARNDDDGMNVTFHEFAHQLDQINGTDGVPILKDRQAYQHWAEVFQRNYEDLVEDVNDGKGPEPLIDPYGATNPAEFFAVATETYFEEGEELQKEHPDLFGQLKRYYQIDPIEWQ